MKVGDLVEVIYALMDDPERYPRQTGVILKLLEAASARSTSSFAGQQMALVHFNTPCPLGGSRTQWVSSEELKVLNENR